ncbi:MAG TPA: LptF/LptG family permease [Rectinemataceae bacterium]|nr:LptF/LptG family permease [Rectinemataceae bacterium]
MKGLSVPAPTGLRGRGSRPRFVRIQAYSAREFLFGFAVCFLFFFSVFFVNQILLMAEDILSKRAPLRDVLLLLLYATPSIIAISFPFASLVGALMAAGRLSSDNEVLAMMAAGIPSRRAFLPFALLGFLFALVSFTMNDFFLPLGTIEFGKLYRKLLTSTPALELKPYSVRHYKDISVVTGAAKGGELFDILIFDRSSEGSSRVISAQHARLDPTAPSGDVVLHLDGIWQQTVKRDEHDSFDWARADSMDYLIHSQGSGGEEVSVGPRDMSSADLAGVIAEKSAALAARAAARRLDLLTARVGLYDRYQDEAAAGLPWENLGERLAPALAALKSVETPPEDRSLQVYKLEYYKKFAIPAGAFFFVFLAYPLGLGAKRSGRAVGFGLGMLISVIYWAFLLGGQTVGTRLQWSPFWAMWVPNAVILASGLVLWLRRLGRG